MASGDVQRCCTTMTLTLCLCLVLVKSHSRQSAISCAFWEARKRLTFFLVLVRSKLPNSANHARLIWWCWRQSAQLVLRLRTSHLLMSSHFHAVHDARWYTPKDGRKAREGDRRPKAYQSEQVQSLFSFVFQIQFYWRCTLFMFLVVDPCWSLAVGTHQNFEILHENWSDTMNAFTFRPLTATANCVEHNI